MAKDSPQQAEWRREFEGLREIDVRLLAEPNGAQVSIPDKTLFAKAWLAERDAAKRDAREGETLAVAKRANAIAIVAAVVAAVAAVLAAAL